VLYNVNGRITRPEEPVFTAASRFYRYGDGFFESMRMAQGHVLFFHRHYRRIQRTAMLLGMVPDQRLSEEALLEMIQQTCAEAGALHARLRLTFLRDGEGLYAPQAGAGMVYVLEVLPLQDAHFVQQEQGLLLGEFNELTKNANYLSMLKTNSALIYVMGAMHARRKGFDDCVLFNDMGRVCETVSCNIFKVDGDKLITPPLSEYCLDGVMRQVVIELAASYGYEVFEHPISVNDLIAGDEILLTSATRGIRYVHEFQGKRFRHAVHEVLFGLLNKAIPGK
jgi:branched-chain amino acid aminotransferase